MVQLRLKHLDLPVFVRDHSLLALGVVQGICVLLCLAFSDLELIKKSLLVFFAAHETHMQVVLLLALLVKDVFLLVEGLLQASLVLLEAVDVGLDRHLVLLVGLLGQGVILDQSLLEQAPKSHALGSVRLHLVLTFLVLAHLHVPLQLFNLAILHLIFELHLPVLPFQLLNQERLQVISLLCNWRMAARMQKVDLLLQGSRQIFNLLLLLLQVDVHLLGLCSQPRVLVARDVVLYLQVAVHVADLLFLSLTEDRRLVRLLELIRHCAWLEVHLPAWRRDLVDWHVAVAAEQDIARAVVVDDLLVDTVAFGCAASLHPCA